MSFASAQYQHDMQEPPTGGATQEWEESRTIVERCQEHHDHDRWLKKATLVDGRFYTGPSVWEGMGHRARQRQERFMRRMEKVEAYHQEIVEQDSCPGCGEYSEGGECCGRICRRDAKFQG